MVRDPINCKFLIEREEMILIIRFEMDIEIRKGLSDIAIGKALFINTEVKRHHFTLG